MHALTRLPRCPLSSRPSPPAAPCRAHRLPLCNSFVTVSSPRRLFERMRPGPFVCSPSALRTVHPSPVQQPHPRPILLYVTPCNTCIEAGGGGGWLHSSERQCSKLRRVGRRLRARVARRPCAGGPPCLGAAGAGAPSPWPAPLQQWMNNGLCWNLHHKIHGERGAGAHLPQQAGASPFLCCSSTISSSRWPVSGGTWSSALGGGQGREGGGRVRKQGAAGSEGVPTRPGRGLRPVHAMLITHRSCGVGFRCPGSWFLGYQTKQADCCRATARGRVETAGVGRWVSAGAPARRHQYHRVAATAASDTTTLPP